jgi:hypothetical protein
MAAHDILGGRGPQRCPHQKATSGSTGAQNAVTGTARLGQHHADVAEAGFIDADEFLHRGRGQPDLVPTQHRTAVNVPSQDQPLHRIRLSHIEIRVRLGQR